MLRLLRELIFEVIPSGLFGVRFFIVKNEESALKFGSTITLLPPSSNTEKSQSLHNQARVVGYVASGSTPESTAWVEKAVDIYKKEGYPW